MTAQILASGKTGANKYENDSPTLVLPDLDLKQIAGADQKLFEVTQGYCLSGNEGAETSLDDDLSIIDDSNIEDYNMKGVQALQTLIAHSNLLEVDPTSTANSLILNTIKITEDLAPDGNDYTVEAPLPLKWEDNLKFNFRAIATNIGAMEASIPELSGLSGSIEMLDEDNAALDRGAVIINKHYTIITKTIASNKKLILLSKSSSNISGKNVIINGDFRIWQKGTSFISVADGTYTADRFQYTKIGAMVHDISRSSDVPTLAQAGRLFNYSMLIDCQTVDSSIAAGDLAAILYKVEGYDWLPLAQRETTLSFWIKATKTGIYSVALRNDTTATADRTCIKEIIINASNAWEYKTLKFPASPSAGSWNYTNGIGLCLSICLASGSNFQSTPDSWQTGFALATSNQVNACDSASNNFYITGVQLEVGAIATPFDHLPQECQLSYCQRYAERINDNASTQCIAPAYAASSTNAIAPINYTRKRSNPTISFSANDSFRVQGSWGAIASTSIAADSVGSSSARLLIGVASGLTTDAGCNITTTSAGYIDINSEL